MRGEVVHFSLYDVGAELRLEKVQRMLGRAPAPAPLTTESPTPAYVGFSQPLEVAWTPEGASTPGMRVEVRLHAVGVVAVRIRLPVTVAAMEELPGASKAARIQGRTLEEASAGWFRALEAELKHAFVEPYQGLPQMETYRAFCLVEAPSAEDLLAHGREDLASLVAGEPRGVLVPDTVAGALKHTIHYYRGHCAILGWDNALVVSPTKDYEDLLDVFEVANLELLEFRTYDAYLDRRLEQSFAALDRLWARGGIFRSARAPLKELSELRVDLARLTDNLHDTGKVFGDWYLAKVHQRLQERFHIGSWEKAVENKMATMEDMYQLAEEEANHRRSLILEVMIVLLFILDVALLFILK
ncbi:MAG: hypothetical protein QOD77_1506 [Thermoplasmata archaeon]|jgi:hypothetical protein|nr:hypothetical protein [Thermoplasmata archaeon]